MLSDVGKSTQRHVAAGFLGATGFWLPVMVAILRTYVATTGAWAEQDSRAALSSRRLGWQVIDDIPMQRFNIDHVAITPAAVLAVETKFRGAGPITAARHRGDVDAARRAAHYTQLLLRSADVRTPAPVQPVLMLWGPGAQVDGGHRYEDGVLVVQGSGDGSWRELFRAPTITAEQTERIERGLTQYQQKRDAHERAKEDQQGVTSVINSGVGRQRTRRRPA